MTEKIKILDIYNPEYSLEVFKSKLTKEQQRKTYWEDKEGNLIRLDNIGSNYKKNIIKILKFAIKRNSIPIDDFSDCLQISDNDYDMYI